MRVHQDEERDREAIRQLGQEWVEAVHHGDVDRLLDLVTDDVVFMPANAYRVASAEENGIRSTRRRVWRSYPGTIRHMKPS